jgi:precorrin-8X/cobalt-precorrin-8 methylmutase
MTIDLKNINMPGDIEKTSFQIIENEVPALRPFEGDEWLIVRRMIHASADFELLNLTRFHPGAMDSGIKALKSGCLIVTDTEMTRMGITRPRMKRLNCRVKCFINDQAVIQKAQEEQTTRASAAVDHALPQLDGAIYVIGNAPTALINLIIRIHERKCRPSLIVGMPVGFVNAAESKDLLLAQEEMPFITIKGRKGGSALAAAAINQLAEITLARGKTK